MSRENPVQEFDGFKGSRKKRKDKTKILLGIICFILVLCLGVGVFGVYMFKKSKDSEIDRLNNIINVTKENNIIIPIDDFKEYAKRYESIIRFSQKYFPEYYVYYGDGGVTFKDLNKDLKSNPFFKNEGNFVYSENGRLDYIDQSKNYKSLQGIDVSTHQYNINWKEVAKDGIEFAFIRVGYRGYTEGKITIDDYFHRNMREAAKAGIKIGVYFFSGAINEAEAVAEANYVLKQIKGYNVTYPIAFDMEEIKDKNNRMAKLTVEQRVAITKAFCDRINSAGYQSIIYGNSKWLVEQLDYPEIAKYQIWYANWDYFTWPYDVKVYQYTSNGKVKGIEGRVDMNIAFYNYQE